MARRKGLGRGLDALLGGGTSVEVVQNTDDPANPAVSTLPVDIIQRGKYQPRTDMHPESLEDLANSIRAQGVIQPIVVRPIGQDKNGKDKYEIVAGERRWRASQLADLEEIPVIIKTMTDQDTIAVALIENIQRENLNPLEEATSLQRLLTEFKLTHQEVSEAVGKSRTSVTNIMRLLDLNDDVKRLLENGDIEMGHAKTILGLKGIKQSEVAQIVVSKDLTVRATEELVKKYQSEQPIESKVEEKADCNVLTLENDLSKLLGALVKVKQTSKKGKGKLIINYNSFDELDGILEHIK